MGSRGSDGEGPDFEKSVKFCGFLEVLGWTRELFEKRSYNKYGGMGISSRGGLRV